MAWTTNSGLSWKTSSLKSPNGYRSCIRIIDGEKMVSCGTNGVDMCNMPNKWWRVSTKGFNVCMVAPGKKLIFFAGDKGKIGLLKL
jgi:hypothetical protein